MFGSRCALPDSCACAFDLHPDGASFGFREPDEGWGTEIGNLGLPDDSATDANDTGAEQSIRANAESHASANALAKQ